MNALNSTTARASQAMAASFDDDAARWAAVQCHDVRADGQFYYSVRSTGVYCRPSCAARPMKRENVGFHPSTEAAEAAGFRACKRCKPDAGTEQLKARAIEFGIGACSLGSVLVAATHEGVCAVLLGDDADGLLRDLHQRFPRAALRGGNAMIERVLRDVVGHIEAPHRGESVSLDLQGTPFQRKVWHALRDIRVGETASYAAIAQRIGEPTAARAVARACGANPVAVLVPCHRVLRSDGSLSGYRWGAARKRELLRREHAL